MKRRRIRTQKRAEMARRREETSTGGEEKRGGEETKVGGAGRALVRLVCDAAKSSKVLLGTSDDEQRRSLYGTAVRRDWGGGRSGMKGGDKVAHSRRRRDRRETVPLSLPNCPRREGAECGGRSKKAEEERRVRCGKGKERTGRRGRRRRRTVSTKRTSRVEEAVQWKRWKRGKEGVGEAKKERNVEFGQVAFSTCPIRSSLPSSLSSLSLSLLPHYANCFILPTMSC
jgi:hypothetical protein